MGGLRSVISVMLLSPPPHTMADQEVISAPAKPEGRYVRFGGTDAYVPPGVAVIETYSGKTKIATYIEYGGKRAQITGDISEGAKGLGYNPATDQYRGVEKPSHSNIEMNIQAERDYRAKQARKETQRVTEIRTEGQPQKQTQDVRAAAYRGAQRPQEGVEPQPGRDYTTTSQFAQSLFEKQGKQAAFGPEGYVVAPKDSRTTLRGEFTKPVRAGRPDAKTSKMDVDRVIDGSGDSQPGGGSDRTDRGIDPPLVILEDTRLGKATSALFQKVEGTRPVQAYRRFGERVDAFFKNKDTELARRVDERRREGTRGGFEGAGLTAASIFSRAKELPKEAILRPVKFVEGAVAFQLELAQPTSTPRTREQLAEEKPILTEVERMFTVAPLGATSEFAGASIIGRGLKEGIEYVRSPGGQRVIPRIRGEEIKVPTTEGEVVIRVVGVEVGGRSMPIATQIKGGRPTDVAPFFPFRDMVEGVRLGSMRSKTTIPKSTLTEEIPAPRTATGTKALLRQTDSTPAEITRIQSRQEVIRELGTEKGTQVTPGEAFSNVAAIKTVKGRKIMDEFLGREKGIIYGSSTIRQIKAGDIDVIYTKKTVAQIQARLPSLVKKLKSAGEDVRISEKNPSLIENVAGEKILEAKSGINEASVSGSEISNVGGLGFDFPNIKEGRIGTTMPFGSGWAILQGEQLTRVAVASSFFRGETNAPRVPGAFRGAGIFPKGKRIKDLPSYKITAEALIDFKRKSINPFKRLSAERASRALEKDIGSFTPEQQAALASLEKSRRINPEEIKVEIIPSESTKGTPTGGFISPSPSPSLSPRPNLPPSPSPYRSPSPSPSLSPRPSPSPSPSPYRSPSPSPSLSPRPSPSPSPSPYRRSSPSLSPRPIPSPSISPSLSPSPTPSTSPFPSPSPSPSPYRSPSPSPSLSPRPSPSPSPSPFDPGVPGSPGGGLFLPRRSGRVLRQAYKVEIRRGGEFTKIASAIPLGKAIRLGTSEAKRTLARTFRVRPEGTTAEEDVSSVSPGGEFREFKIRAGKKIETPFTFIQKAKYSLSSGSERREIQSFRRLQP